MNKNTIKLINDTISSIMCYINGDVSYIQLVSWLQEGLHLPSEVVDHVITVINR